MWEILKHLPSIPYPPARDDGYWSPITSTLTWCEENYYATIYTAEIVNSFTNLIFLYLSIKGIRSCIKYGHDTVFLVAFVGYATVGTGSFLFHSTLKYPMQLIDELSMIYTTCIMCFASFARGRSQSYSFTLGIFLASLAVFITGYYHYIQDPLFHQNAYALLTATVVFRAMYVMENGLRPSRRTKEQELELIASITGRSDMNGDAQTNLAKSHPNGLNAAEIAELKRRDERDLKILKTMWLAIAYGLSTFLGAFAIWNLDNIYCSNLRRWRREIGLPWGILLEGHGWWHLMTGIGAYFYLTWGIWLRYCLNGQQDDVKLVWPRTITSFPEVVRHDSVPAIKLNGQSKKEL